MNLIFCQKVFVQYNIADVISAMTEFYMLDFQGSNHATELVEAFVKWL